MQTLIGQIDNIIFEDDSFFIASLKSKEKISGHYYESEITDLKGAAISLSGEYEEHKKYGKSFKFTSLKVNQNQLFFFLNKVIKGFPKKLSAELIEKFGEEGLIDVLDNDIEKLLEFKGIKEKRLQSIQNSWKKYRSMRQLGEFLSPYDVSATLLTTIAMSMKEVKDPINRIKNNPYVLTSIAGIGFKRADEIALKMGIEEKADRRLASAMDYVLNEYCEQQGNSCVHKDILFSRLDDSLNFLGQNALYEGVLVERVIEGNIIALNHDRYAPLRLYEAEKLLYDEFIRRAKIKEEPIVKDLDGFLEHSDLNLGEQQRSALEKINDGLKILFLIGYAGTGKSTTSRTILQLLKTKHDEKTIMTCALSGIASQRIGDTTGFESSTIQALLVKYEERDYFPFNVVLIDEASMINSSLFARLLVKVPRDAILIIVGDDAQLPPIGAGNVLSDVISLEIAPIVKLTKIYRQHEDQAIALIANDIRQSVVPHYKEEYEDFSFIDVSISNYYGAKKSSSANEFSALRDENTESILATIISKAMEHIPKARARLKAKEIASYLNYFQVISPMKSGVLGTDNLNKVLQEYFNPDAKKVIKRGEKEFRLMDKVVHIKNENMTSWSGDEFKDNSESAQRRIFNGMVGLLFKIEEEEGSIYVFYPNEDLVVIYELEQLKSHLMLSYALTIHKVQGMEYDIVVIPMSFSHYIMHNTKLLYTAITRAKNRCFIIGESGAFESACRRNDVNNRDTIILELGHK